MNIRQVSYGIIGSLLMAGACTACVNEEYKNKAKSQAVEYLNGYDLLRAERMSEQQHHNDQVAGAKVAYWDSLLIEAKSKEAYARGQQMIKDSAEHKFFRKDKYKFNLDTIIDRDWIYKIEEEYSKYADAKTFMKLRKKEPTTGYVAINAFPYQIHYWNLITLAGKQREAYNKGAADERAKLSSKIE